LLEARIKTLQERKDVVERRADSRIARLERILEETTVELEALRLGISRIEAAKPGVG